LRTRPGSALPRALVALGLALAAMGCFAAILERRGSRGPEAYVLGTETGAYQSNIQTA
jgi:hypothetical protein